MAVRPKQIPRIGAHRIDFRSEGVRRMAMYDTYNYPYGRGRRVSTGGIMSAFARRERERQRERFRGKPTGDGQAKTRAGVEVEQGQTKTKGYHA